MTAKIENINGVPAAIYKRDIIHSVAEVWSYLTENEKLQQWFPELEIKLLENEGEIHFNFGDGSYEKIEITELEPNKVFAFSWPPKNSVRFELEGNNQGCKLVFIEYLHEITDHTPKDLTGWHVCLDVIETLLDGKIFEDRKSYWQERLPQYQELLKELSN
ncbi:SRPBCC family protein [Oceanobacillus chungangensis]|uniref:Activator of Hsp90 ATPase 1 family protein n=1 Tax=Oceanobacillus chungangensis TaxID=1229152 RepID=A0A3D8PIP6_9BACI|nr:SRPBCC family protein [Oceanobacillus chungangensis]RDW15055.1 activator of Hsp90 ATPase 1 family protein [Oceanobacillus chungangensis]